MPDTHALLERLLSSDQAELVAVILSERNKFLEATGLIRDNDGPVATTTRMNIVRNHWQNRVEASKLFGHRPMYLGDMYSDLVEMAGVAFALTEFLTYDEEG